MNISPCSHRRLLFAAASLSMLLTGLVTPAADAAPAVVRSTVNAPVTVTDNGGTWTLDNGIVRATVNKRNGNMTGLEFHGINTMNNQGGYWESTPAGAVAAVTIDPKSNGGERAEVSVKGGPGRGIGIELRYTLARGISGIYAYGIYTHPAASGAAGFGENRFITKLNHTFNWISVDTDRNMLECTPQDWGTGVVIHAKEQRILITGVYKNSFEHNYSFNAVQY